MAAHEDKVQAVMVGVGAAFDYEAGTSAAPHVDAAPQPGMFLYRLMQDPKRLFKRYLTHQHQIPVVDLETMNLSPSHTAVAPHKSRPLRDSLPRYGKVARSVRRKGSGCATAQTEGKNLR